MINNCIFENYTNIDEWKQMLENVELVYKVDPDEWNTEAVINKKIKKVIFNPPAAIVYWGDKTKTVVKCVDDEKFDKEKGLAMAICKHLYGEGFHSIFKKYIE